MSTLVSCTSNPITQLTTLFQDSAWQSTSPFFTADETHSQLSSFRTQSSPDSTDCFESSWNSFTQDWQQFRETTCTNDNDEDEFRQEWSNESFTQLYIQQNGLDKLTHNYANVNINHNVNTRISARSESNGMTFADEFLSLDSSTTLTEEFKAFLSDTTSDILYSDLYSAHLYLLDQLLSQLLDHAIASTCKPSPSSEWNFTKLFCPSRWNNREDEKTLEEKYLEGVATDRLSMLLGHLGKQGRSIEWAGEFCMS